MPLDVMDDALYVIHSAAKSTLKLWREPKVHSEKDKRLSLCRAGIPAVQFEISFTEGLVLQVLATVLKRTYSICASS